VQKGLLAPSNDGKGKLLIAIVFDDKLSGSRYHGVTYDIATADFDEVPVGKLWNSFVYTYSMPFEINDIQLVSSLKLLLQIGNAFKYVEIS
jgi:hypothetical protein